MRIVPLGVGGWASSFTLGPSSFLVDFDGFKILLDAGEGVYRALRVCGFDVPDIEAVLVSHRHGDHFMGLATLALYSGRYGRVLRVFGPEDLDVRGLLRVLGIEHYGSAIDFRPLRPGDRVDIGGVSVRAVEADHTVPALAYRLDYGGRCSVYWRYQAEQCHSRCREGV